MDTRKPLRTNYRKGGMKKVLEEEMAAKNDYVAIVGIRIRESAEVKTVSPS
jgi:hypothetical protein